MSMCYFRNFNMQSNKKRILMISIFVVIVDTEQADLIMIWRQKIVSLFEI